MDQFVRISSLFRCRIICCYKFKVTSAKTYSTKSILNSTQLKLKSNSFFFHSKIQITSFFLDFLTNILQLQITHRMGNIEIASPTKRKNIFYHKEQPSRHSRSISRSKIFSAIKKSPNQHPNQQLFKSPLTDRKKNIQDENLYQTSQDPLFNATQRIQTTSEKHSQENQLETLRQHSNRLYENYVAKKNIQTEKRQFDLESTQKYTKITKKIRGFNDFLNEIKRKMKEKQEQNYIQGEVETDRNRKNRTTNSYGEILGEKQQHREEKSNQISLSLSLHLENQKIELEKYKKLVERELSKNHSIENISIQTKGQGEKLLIIKYQNLSREPSPKNITAKEQQNRQLSLKFEQSKRFPKQFQAILDENQRYDKKVQEVAEQEERELKEKINRINNIKAQMKAQIQMLNQVIFREQQKLKVNGFAPQIPRSSLPKHEKEVKKPQCDKIQESNGFDLSEKSVPKKMSKINGLFSKISEIYEEQMESQRMVKDLLGNAWDSEEET